MRGGGWWLRSRRCRESGPAAALVRLRPVRRFVPLLGRRLAGNGRCVRRQDRPRACCRCVRSRLARQLAAAGAGRGRRSDRALFAGAAGRDAPLDDERHLRLDRRRSRRDPVRPACRRRGVWRLPGLAAAHDRDARGSRGRDDAVGAPDTAPLARLAPPRCLPRARPLPEEPDSSSPAGRRAR